MRQRRQMNQINVVPYIDVMLVLLVIFMVTAPMIQTGSVDLPTVGEVPQPPTEAVFVVIKADGAFEYKASASAAAEPVELGALQQRLAAALAANAEQSVVVAADKAVIYEKVMDMLDDLRQAGFEKVGLQTQTGA